MTEPGSDDVVRFYFSFRSPYAWLAAERLDDELGGLGVPIERIPVYPSPENFPNDPTKNADKQRHLVQDVLRLAREAGRKVVFPPAGDPDWALSHAACLGVDREGDGSRFMLEVFRKRFTEGCDLGEDDVIAEAARATGLDADTVLGFGHSQALREEVAGAWEKAQRDDHVFGVPTFVYAGKLYWGQDRMRFVRSAIERKSGRAG